MTTHLPPSPGWYPDPSGSSAQKYRDGQGWQNADPQPALSRDDIRAAMAENRSIWATNAMAAYSLIIGCVSLLLLLMCGVGGATAVDADVEQLVNAADVALYRAKHQGRNQVAWNSEA